MLLDIDYNPLQGHVAFDDAYRVHTPSPPLNRWIQCYWQLDVPVGTFSYHSVPDNSVDWIINLDAPEDTFLVPPFLSAVTFEVTGPAAYFGIRFRLFGQQGLISTPVGEWSVAGDAVDAAEVLPSQIPTIVFDALQKTTQFDERCNNLTFTLLAMLTHTEIDSRLTRYVRYCLKNTTSNIDLSDKQCSEFGVSARQLRRLTKLYLGLMPKDFARVLRFQTTLKAMSMGEHTPAWAEHYYDQPHYIREFKRLSGFTPAQFNGLSVLYNHRSIT